MSFDYDPGSTAVIVVDCQNDFCHPDGALYAEGSEDAISGVNDVIDKVDAQMVIHTRDSHLDGDEEFEQWGRHCLSGSWGWEIHDDVTVPNPGKWEWNKNTYDAFFETGLNEALRNRGIDTLIICGTLANVCVQESASSAALYGYDVFVVEDAVGYLNEGQRDAALQHIDFLIGDVVSTRELSSE